MTKSIDLNLVIKIMEFQIENENQMKNFHSKVENNAFTIYNVISLK